MTPCTPESATRAREASIAELLAHWPQVRRAVELEAARVPDGLHAEAVKRAEERDAMNTIHAMIIAAARAYWEAGIKHGYDSAQAEAAQAVADAVEKASGMHAVEIAGIVEDARVKFTAVEVQS